MLLYGNSGKANQYCFSVSKVICAESANTVIIPPQKFKSKGYNFYYFMAYGYEWVVILSRSSKDLIREYSLLGLKNELRVFVQEMSRANFIQYLREKIGEDFIKKLKKQDRNLNSKI